MLQQCSSVHDAKDSSIGAAFPAVNAVRSACCSPGTRNTSCAQEPAETSSSSDAEVSRSLVVLLCQEHENMLRALHELCWEHFALCSLLSESGALSTQEFSSRVHRHHQLWMQTSTGQAERADQRSLVDAVTLPGASAMLAKFLGLSGAGCVRAACAELKESVSFADARSRHLYIIGGRNQEDVLNTVERLDTGGCWETCPPMLQCSIQPAVVEMNGSVYVYGECLERFDPCSGTRWENLGSGSERRCMAAVGVHESSIYICGGSNNCDVLSSIERYNSVTGRWEALPPMRQHRSRAMAGILDGHFYVCAGYDGFKTLRTCERFNFATECWEAIPHMIQRRCMAASAVMNECLLVCGGSNREPSKLMDEPLRSCESFDPRLDRWQSLPCMETGRSRAASCLVNGLLYVCGGLGGEALTSVERLDLSAWSWETLPPLSAKRFGAAVGSLEGCLFVCGGNDGSDFLSSVERFDLKAGAWKNEKAMNENRSWPVVAVA